MGYMSNAGMCGARGNRWKQSRALHGARSTDNARTGAEKNFLGECV